MSLPTTRWILTAAAFLLIFLSGFWLARSGKPYSTALFTLHKLIALGALVLLGLTVYRAAQAAPLHGLQMVAIIAAAVCFLAAIVTGGLVSVAREMPLWVQALHRVLPFLTLISSALTLYLVLARAALSPL